MTGSFCPGLSCGLGLAARKGQLLEVVDVFSQFTRRGRVQDVLSQIPLSAPWTVGEFLDWMSEHAQSEVVLSPWSGPRTESGGRCGLLLGSPERLIIKYDLDHSVRHQRQQIFHECAHILCQHEGEPFCPTESVLTQGIDVRSIEWMMRRDTFDTPTEKEAEVVGTQLAIRSRGPVDDSSLGALHRIAGTFGPEA